MHDPRRVLDFPALLNARDLGGYPTIDGATTKWCSLLRSDDLAQLTPEGLAALDRFGVATVIDLRWPEEAQQRPSPLTGALPHVRYQRISLLVGSQIDWQGVRLECEKAAWKCAVLEHTRAELREVLRAIGAAPPEPLLFHCVAGKDRTGIISALLLTLADATPEAIAFDYAISGNNLLEAYVARHADVDRAEIEQAVHCPEQGVYNMLDYLAIRGGVRAFLQDIGLTSEEIDRLRARLR
jgi:protein-tyrosine phosphatase